MGEFKRGWLRKGRIYSDKGFSIAIEDRSHLTYRSRGKKMTIAGELLSGGNFAGHLANASTWDDGSAIDSREQQRIIENIRQAFASQGLIADFD
jgi:hypothetical protein